MNDILTLLCESSEPREVFCEVRSIGMREFYQANATDFHPEIKFVLADYLEYQGETLVRYDGTDYKASKQRNTGRGTVLLNLEEVWR